MKANYTFDAEKHIHYINGIRVPGVTTVLKAEGFIDTDFFNDEACYRGNYVHKACELINRGKLDLNSIKPEFKGYIDAFWTFRQENSPIEFINSEMNVFSETWGYAGIIDFISQTSAGWLYLWDIKTSKVKAKWWKYQLAGYRAAYQEMTGKRITGCFSLQLTENGTYKVEQYDDVKENERNWFNILTVHELKLKEGIIKPQEEIL